jgi:hypothetical protein
MFLARIVGAGKAQVYPLSGALFFPRSWQFVSYQRGAAAIGMTQTEALRMARRRLEQRLLPRPALHVTVTPGAW